MSVDLGALLVRFLHPCGALTVMYLALDVDCSCVPSHSLDRHVSARSLTSPPLTSASRCFRSTSAYVRWCVARSFRWMFASPPASGVTHTRVWTLTCARSNPKPGLGPPGTSRWGELSCSSRRVGCGARPGGSTWRGPRSTPSLWTWNNARKTREVRPRASRTFTHSNAG